MCSATPVDVLGVGGLVAGCGLRLPDVGRSGECVLAAVAELQAGATDEVTDVR
jgi:hypothetical protein